MQKLRCNLSVHVTRTMDAKTTKGYPCHLILGQKGRITRLCDDEAHVTFYPGTGDPFSCWIKTDVLEADY